MIALVPLKKIEFIKLTNKLKIKKLLPNNKERTIFEIFF